jgi:hypothetical protein
MFCSPKIKHPLRGSLSVLIVFLLISANATCTKSVHIPRSEYENIDASDAEYWRVTTRDGTVYSVTSFTITDSTFGTKQYPRRTYEDLT